MTTCVTVEFFVGVVEAGDEANWICRGVNTADNVFHKKIIAFPG